MIIRAIILVLLITPASLSGGQQFTGAIRAAEGLPRLYSLLVSLEGQLILEEYFNGKGPNQTANIKSVSKSLLSTLVGIAIDQGHIESVDQPISDFYEELLSTDSDDARRSITIGNLLSMQAGLETTSFYNYGAWVQSKDWVDYALRQPLLSQPGTRMHYSTGNTHVLSDILTQATGKSTLHFAREVLAQPLGIELSAWPTDPDGVYFGGNNMELTPRELIVFGELYLNNGRANGKQIVPEDWVDASLSRRIESSWRRGLYYGYGWWSRNLAGFNTPYAWGYGGQFIMLVPDLNLVVVTTSNSQPTGTRRSYTRDIHALVENQIIPEVLD